MSALPTPLFLLLTVLPVACLDGGRPGRLSQTEETIEVSYVNWACDCPDWIETRYVKESGEVPETRCIYLEPATPEVSIPAEFYHERHLSQTLRLTGRFYRDKGIPAGYDPKTTGDIQSGKVFRYHAIAFIDH